ncbi:hypothetical protein ACFL3J_00015 [Candidatus Omnitrophota bacterium]
MKKGIFAIMALGIICSLILVGCGEPKATSSKAAIDISKTLATKQAQADYLIGQAKAFYNSKEFQGAIDIAQYVLRYLDKDSVQARNLLDEAKDSLAAQLKAKIEQAKKDLSF